MGSNKSVKTTALARQEQPSFQSHIPLNAEYIDKPGDGLTAYSPDRA